MASSGKYVPIARIQIGSSSAAGQPSDTYAGFSISALPMDGKKAPSGQSAVQMLSYNANGKEDELVPFSVLTKPGTEQPFSLVYDGSSVTIGLGTTSKSFPAKVGEPVVRVICSTGEFLFTDLSVSPSS